MLFRLIIAGLLVVPTLSAARLSSGQVTAEFNDRGLVSLRDNATRFTYRFTRDDFAIRIGGRTYESSSMGTPVQTPLEWTLVFSYEAGPLSIDVVYELRPEWRFLSKQIVVRAGTKFQVEEIAVFEDRLADTPEDVYAIRHGRENLGTRDYGAALRFEKSRGLLVTAQNPFLAFERDGEAFTLSYKPDMEWNPEWGAFEADRGLLAPYELSGRRQPEQMLAEWRMGPFENRPGMDVAEVETFTGLVRSFLLYRPAHPLNIMVGWCVNDYQIDIGTPEGRTEYKRIFDMATQLGAENVLFAPADSQVSNRSESRDDWGWEYLLWLGLGPKIRRAEFDPATGSLPAPVQEMLDYAGSRGLKLVAYVYPVMGFTQNKEWLVGARGNRANLGIHSFQDWLIQALEDFHRRTGISGYSFDHTFLNLEGASRYSQWWGWRRVMEKLRTDIPDLVVDGRQAYQLYGPWSWLAGSYPHPTMNDEQPESFVSFPDLKFDRVSADRERFTAYRYRNYEFAPSEIVPGFITHQTARSNDSGRMPEASTPAGPVLTPFRQRDWDYLGWRYSLLSSIAVAGWNNVLNMIPARDPDEFRLFPEADRAWFRHWIDWTDAQKNYLRHTRTILGQPAIGKADGTAAVTGDSGFVFLFNPNGRRVHAEFTLDDTIGLEGKGKYTLRELYPLEQRLLAKPGIGPWSYGDTISMQLDGGSATVLEIAPYQRLRQPELYNSPGEARLDGKTLRLTGIMGEAGTSETLLVSAPSGDISEIELGGRTFPATRGKDGIIEIPVRFAGAPFRHYQQVGDYDPPFTGGRWSGSVTIPQRVFDQLDARRKAWPIAWTSEDERSTWLAPHRLLLYVQFAEPDDQWKAALTIDGRPVPLEKAYASVRVNKRNFTGFYADVSSLAPDREHKIELELPAGLKPGQFQGVFFENVETAYTGEILP